jgi:tetratricopeptide (TPR) repeat protein
VLLTALAGLVLLAVLAFVLFSGGNEGGSSGDRPTARSRARSTPPPTATATATPKAKEKARDESTPTPTPTPTATATTTATATPPPSGGPNLARARQLQVQGYNARRAGNYEAALAASTQALKACGDAHALDPCGYALFEIGAALNALGRPNEAIPYLERRLNEYGDNAAGEVQAELDRARGETPSSGKGKGKGHGKGGG